MGRDYELSQLRAALDGALQRRTQLVEIVGEAGIGKSRLVAELPQLAPGFFVHALTLDAQAALAERTSIDDPEPLRVEAQQIFERLGVVALPRVPLPDTFFEREHRL